MNDGDELRNIKSFPQLVKYLRDKLDWPVESEDFDELTFDYQPDELGLDLKTAAKIQEIKQLRPLAHNQPWGIFFVKFEPKSLPVVERLWDIANTIRLGQLRIAPLYGVATDDSHNYHGKPGSHTGRGWIQVRAKHLTPESLIRAINRGDFYASSGVTLREITYDADGGKLSLEIEPRGDTTFTTSFIGTPTDYDSASQPRTDKDGKPIRASRKYSSDVGKLLATAEGTSPSYALTGKELYVRAVVTSSRPHRDPSYSGQLQQAWTQAVGWSGRISTQ